MISGFGRIVSYAFNSLDQTSGANDVIVVRHRDGTLHCTPFQVRFGKVKVLSPQDKIVTIEVNNKHTKAVMKIGPDGEAFWLQPVHHAVDRPESPLESPKSPEQLSAAAGSPPAMELLADTHAIAEASTPLPAAEFDSGQLMQPPVSPVEMFEGGLSSVEKAEFDQLLRSLRSEEAAQHAPNASLTLSKFASVDNIVDDETQADAPSPVDAQNLDEGHPPQPGQDWSSSHGSDEDDEGGSEDELDTASERVVCYQQTLTPTVADLEKLCLIEGLNTVRYSTHTSLRGHVVLEASIYLWTSDTKIVVSDVDGTITKSDVWGHLLPLIGKDWTHAGICSLYTKVHNNGYEFVYLTARSISQVERTREFLWSIEQDGDRLPRGPVLTAPDRFFTALTQEVSKKSHEFKIACLKGVAKAFPKGSRPFYAGFGNRVGDVISYTATQIPRHKIFIIDPNSILHVCRVKQSYKNLAHLVDVTFPPVESEKTQSQCRSKGGLAEGESVDAEFNSFNFWRIPPEQALVDSPTKNARKAKRGMQHPDYVSTGSSSTEKHDLKMAPTPAKNKGRIEVAWVAAQG